MRPRIQTSTKRELVALAARLNQARPTNIGYPGAVDFDYTPLSMFFAHHLLNNVGDPAIDGRGPNHTKSMEREVVNFVADLLAAPADDRWGYVTSGASEGNLHSLYLARRANPGGVVYASQAAHYSVAKAADLLAMPLVTVRCDQFGEMDYDDLRAQVHSRRSQPAIVVATIGTTMTEAVDDIRRIGVVLDELAVPARFIHADAALAGLPLALLDNFGFASGADSMIVSGHKFIGSPMPCGVVVVRAHHLTESPSAVPYTGSTDTTISGSRSGHAPLLLWYALRHYGVEGLRTRAERSRRLAAYTKKQLDDLGWRSFRHPHAFTVVLRTPPPGVLDRWVLATEDGWSHIVCVPGVRREQIDGFIADLKRAIRTANGARSATRWQRALGWKTRRSQPNPPYPVVATASLNGVS